MQLSCVPVSVDQTPRALSSASNEHRQNSKACCRCSSSLDTSATILPRMQQKYVLWKSNSLDMIKRKKSPCACAMVWIVPFVISILSRASSHKPMRCAMSSLHAASTHSCTTRNPQAVAIFKYQGKAPSGDSMYWHVLPASISKGKLTSTLTRVIARVLLQLRTSATWTSVCFLHAR